MNTNIYILEINRYRARNSREWSWERTSLDTPLQRDRWMVIASASKRDAGADR